MKKSNWRTEYNYVRRDRMEPSRCEICRFSHDEIAKTICDKHDAVVCWLGSCSLFEPKTINASNLSLPELN